MKYLFKLSDRQDFMQAFAIQWLASMDAINYLSNCSSGWKHHRPAVEDAEYLAEKAWDEWVETIGVQGQDGPVTSTW